MHYHCSWIMGQPGFGAKTNARTPPCTRCKVGVWDSSGLFPISTSLIDTKKIGLPRARDGESGEVWSRPSMAVPAPKFPSQSVAIFRNVRGLIFLDLGREQLAEPARLVMLIGSMLFSPETDHRILIGAIRLSSYEVVFTTILRHDADHGVHIGLR